MLRVAVIGGGIGGLSAAVALRAAGAQVHVFEQARQLSEVGGGIRASAERPASPLFGLA